MFSHSQVLEDMSYDAHNSERPEVYLTSIMLENFLLTSRTWNVDKDIIVA